MTEQDMRILTIFMNSAILLVMLIPGLWVGFDARKTGRSKLESFMWGFFAGWFILVGPLFYVYFKKKFYTNS